MAVLLKRMWQHILPRRRIQFGILCVLMIISSFAEVISIGTLLPFLGVLTAPERVFQNPLAKPVIQALNLDEPKQMLLPLTIAFCIAVVVSGAMRLLLLWAQTRLSYAIGADFSFSVYRRTLYQPYSVHLSRNSSEIISGITGKTISVIYGALIPILTIITSVIMLFMILSALVAINPTIALVAIVGFGAIYISIIQIMKKRLSLDSKRIARESTNLMKTMQEGLGGIRDVLIDGTQATYCDIYRNADLPLRRAQANITIISGSPRFGTEALGMVLIAVLAYSLAGSSAGFATAIPVLGALALGAQRMLPVLQQLYSSWTTIKGGEASLKDVLDLLDQPLPEYTLKPMPEPIHFQRDISLKGLSFRYTQDAPWVLQNMNFIIPKGSRIGFMGITGSGKSTLLDIFMGLLQPTEGNMAIDGVPISSENYRAWQAHIAHVPQAIYLSDTSITENIAFGIPVNQIDHERVRQAAQKAQISETIETWNKQYKTIVGERGIRLSGGQRQRIGIARALYKKADVIVFDEATSALDNETEHDVMEAIESLGNDLTILIVAHRLTTLKYCTQIIELAEEGVRRTGSYYEMVEQIDNDHAVIS